MFCKYCGAETVEGIDYCGRCGKSLVETSAKEEKKDGGSLNVGMLVWSIINMLITCQVAGIVAFVFTILAKYEENEKAKKYIGVAKISNIVGTAYGVLSFIVVIFIFVYFVAMMSMLGSAIGSSMYY